MKMVREKLLRHLRGVYCGGLIPEATFAGPFAAQAVAGDQTILVETVGMEGADVLTEPVGVIDLELLIDALSVENVELVEVQVREGRLLVLAGNASVALVTADPANTSTRVGEENMTKVKELASVTGDGYPLDAAAVKTFLALLQLLRADDVTLILSGESGLRVGHGTENQGQVPLPGISVTESSERLLSAAALRAVLSLSDKDSRVWFSDAFVTVRNGAHVYYLSSLAGEE